jgi:hypothetical protein
MPKILERCVKQLTPKHGRSSAFAICTKGLQKSGNLKKGTNKATSKGKKRGEMTPGERAKDRASKYSKRKNKKSDYTYNKKTNRAKVKR